MAPTDPQYIITCMDSLTRKNSSGHDNITSAMLKYIKNTVCITLTNIFNK